MSKVWKLFVMIVVLVLSNLPTMAQCAMCRATLENNVSNGNVGIAAGINFGILYLFTAPYLVIAIIGYFWFKSSKRNS